ncbi:TPA: HaeIII family restriction endonuclease [Bacillus toyonensis]|nr:HaeIII family restriction endonuclease [Bacillus toyonensis]
MSTPATRGKAFEFATIREIVNTLGASPFSNHTVNFINDGGQTSFNSLSIQEQNKMNQAAHALVQQLLILEPWIEDHRLEVEYVVTVSGTPDVVDVYLHVCNRKVGISLKSNHDAARHSRVSPRIDVAQAWLGLDTNQEYMQSIQRIFTDFLAYCENNNITLYRELTANQKDELLYSPVTCAFETLLQESLVNNQQSLPALSNMISYLIGNNDFYKASANFNRGQLTLMAFDLRNTLSPNQVLTLPTQCLNISRPTRNNNMHNYINIECNNSWEIEMRIHNASSRIENSLKWDVKLKSIPQNIWTNTIQF